MATQTKSYRKRAAQGRFSFLARFVSFRHAGNGLLVLLEEQHNVRIHVGVALAVITLGLLIGLDPVEWIVVVLAIGLVLMAEAFNSAIEYLADAAVPEESPLIGKAKDVAAAGVLLAAMVSVVVGAWAFWP